MERIIAIDGPAASGKSTLAKNLSRALGFLYLDTGAMYRAIALKAKRSGIASDDAPSLSQIAETARIEFATDNEGQRVLLDGQDVTDEIRLPEISTLASEVSVHSSVRRAMVRLQRQMAQLGHGLVCEGRDTTTVVFPKARLKIFLTASAQARAMRRCKELEERGTPISYEDALSQIIERDRRDSTRADSPLVKAADAVEIDTDDLSIEEVLAVALEHWRRRDVD